MLGYAPYAWLGLASALALAGVQRFAWVAFAAAIVCGFLSGALTWPALLSLAALGASLLALRRVSHAVGRAIAVGCALGLSVALSNYMPPGFHNLPVFLQTRFAADSTPFTMYLNFDKTSAGFLLFQLFVVAGAPSFTWAQVRTTALIWLVLVLLLLPLAYAFNYVRFDPKWPALAWVWMLNNLLFVCLAEEALFRGLIQGGLRACRAPAWLSILIAAALFGLAHWRGGLVYVALALVAGLFYGYAFERTGRLQASMGVHFGLNLTHFLLFSYPALTPTP